MMIEVHEDKGEPVMFVGSCFSCEAASSFCDNEKPLGASQASIFSD